MKAMISPVAAKPSGSLCGKENSGNRTDVVFRPADAAPLDASPSLAQRARRLWVKMGAVRERWRFGTTRKQ